MLSFTMLSACSSKFAYNNVDWLLYWYLDDYIELEKDQKQRFDQELDTWLVWHRGSELNAYKKQLEQIQQDILQGKTTQEQWLSHFEHARSHWLRLRNTVTPELVAMAPLLSDSQINSLFDELEKQNAKREKERNENTFEERTSEVIEDIEKTIKGQIGRLSAQQKQYVAEHVGQTESNFEDWMLYRRSIQAQAKQLLLQRNSDKEFQAKLQHLIAHPEEYQSESFIEKSQRNRARYAELLSKLSQSLSAKQIKKLNRELNGLIEDLDDLMSE
jgi:hypothetical protein